LKILVDEASLQYMAGARIDYIDNERGKGFWWKTPILHPPARVKAAAADQVKTRKYEAGNPRPHYFITSAL